MKRTSFPPMHWSMPRIYLVHANPLLFSWVYACRPTHKRPGSPILSRSESSHAASHGPESHLFHRPGLRGQFGSSSPSGVRKRGCWKTWHFPGYLDRIKSHSMLAASICTIFWGQRHPKIWAWQSHFECPSQRKKVYIPRSHSVLPAA
jgi:hypothetical protein